MARSAIIPCWRAERWPARPGPRVCIKETLRNRVETPSSNTWGVNVRDSVRHYSEKRAWYELVLTWKKDALQHRGLCGGRGLLLLLFLPLSSSKTRSSASSRSTILATDTNGVGFCRARARALLTTAHISLPEMTNSQQMAKLESLESRHQNRNGGAPKDFMRTGSSIVFVISRMHLHTVVHLCSYFNKSLFFF